MRQQSKILITALVLGLLLAGYLGSYTSSANTLTEANKLVVGRYYAECWNQGNLAALSEIFAADFQDEACLAEQPAGLAGFEQVISSVLVDFSDPVFTVQEMIAENDLVTVRWDFQATFGATGTPVSFSGHETWKVKDGVIVQRWGNIDFLQLMTEVFPSSTPIPSLPGSTRYKTTLNDISAVRSYYNEIFNNRRSDLFQSRFSSDFIDHSPDPGQTPDLDGFTKSVETVRDGFFNSQFNIDDLTVEGDKVTVHWTYQGNFPATGAPLEFTGIDVWLVRDGLINARWGEFDQQTFVAQVGFSDGANSAD